MEVNVTDKERAQIRQDLGNLSENIGGAQITISGIETIAYRAGFDLSPIKPQLDVAETLLKNAQESHDRLGSVLGAVGAIGSGQAQPVTGNELALLSTIGSDDSHELLDLLEKAQAVAERIDASRGYCVDEKMPLQPGESRGTDLAEFLSMLALRVRREATGGQSRHE